jgi:DNA-binding helix-hairpin-helix protein with protein kinase domain
MPINNLPIARPEELISAPSAGYIMPLLAGVIPLADLQRAKHPAVTDASWYLETGGLRRRLRVLARVADVIAALHATGIAYGDPSPWNVLVSADPSKREVWLIDSDNMTYESSVVDASLSLFTPGYGAPELFEARSGINTLTDAHALMVMAYQTLVLIHPLIGDRVQQGDPELEEAAFAGRLPWIDHPTDATNRSSHGIRRSVVLAPRLTRVCDRAFGEGLTDPLKRPGVAALADALNSASDFTVTCNDCNATHYANSRICPWCEAVVPPVFVGEIYRWDPTEGINKRLLHAFALEPHAAFSIDARLGGSRWVDGGVEIFTDGKGIRASVIGDAKAWIGKLDGSRFQPLRAKPIELSAQRGAIDWIVHTGDRDSSHRVIVFRRREASK